jgi:hypothetical protein
MPRKNDRKAPPKKNSLESGKEEEKKNALEKTSSSTKETALNKKRKATVLEEKDSDRTLSAKGKEKQPDALLEDLSDDESGGDSKEKLGSALKKAKTTRKGKPSALEKTKASEEEEEEEIVDTKQGALETASKNASALEARAKVSHAVLNRKAEDIGRQLRRKLEAEAKSPPSKIADEESMASKIEEISNLTKVSTGFFESNLHSEQLKANANYGHDRIFTAGGTFEDWYRDWAKQEDEFVSTSTVRELLKGMLDVKEFDLPDEAMHARIGELVDLMSVVRAPTGFVGFAFQAPDPATGDVKDYRLQHIATPKSQVFAEHKQTKTEHEDLDTKRKDNVLNGMEEALQTDGTAEDVVLAGVLRGIEYSLNNFVAPATASNISPHLRLPAKKDEQTEYREKTIKGIYEILGGTVPAADTSLTSLEILQSPWRGPEPAQTVGTFNPRLDRSVTALRLPIEPNTIEEI